MRRYLISEKCRLFWTAPNTGWVKIHAWKSILIFFHQIPLEDRQIWGMAKRVPAQPETCEKQHEIYHSYEFIVRPLKINCAFWVRNFFKSYERARQKKRARWKKTRSFLRYYNEQTCSLQLSDSVYLWACLFWQAVHGTFARKMLEIPNGWPTMHRTKQATISLILSDDGSRRSLPI